MQSETAGQVERAFSEGVTWVLVRQDEEQAIDWEMGTPVLHSVIQKRLTETGRGNVSNAAPQGGQGNSKVSPDPTASCLPW